MSSIAHGLTDDASAEHLSFGLKEFTGMEKMLLFAVINECERCICSEGGDCLSSARPVSCPFVAVRKEYSIDDVSVWKELVR